MCGLGAEVIAVVMEQAFDELDEPVGRLHTDPVGHPFSPAHENAVVVSVERIVSAAQAVMAGQPEIPRRLTVGAKPAAVAQSPQRVAVATSGGRSPGGERPRPARFRW